MRYIPLPEGPARKQIELNLLSQQHYSLSEAEVEAICNATDGKGLVVIYTRGCHSITSSRRTSKEGYSIESVITSALFTV